MGKRWVRGMRDAFFDSLYVCARKNKDIVLVSSDTGAICLDRFRKDLRKQFVNVGIAEQNMVGVAAGLAKSGKRVFVYAIVPFAVMRCYEQIRVDLCCMNLPVSVIGIGAGFDYSTLGPTHHGIEDISLMCSLPQMAVYSPSDSVAATAVAPVCCSSRTPCYVRLDRSGFPLLYRTPGQVDYSAGFSVLRQGTSLAILSTGRMSYIALRAARRLARQGIDASVIDVYTLKPFPQDRLWNVIASARAIVTLEEHFLTGGLGSIVTQMHSRKRGRSPVRMIGIPMDFCRKYGNREYLRALYGLDTGSVVRTISSWVKSMGAQGV